ncbi:hypothetical protein NP493_132g00024 [Ridgeia piscesae]|uniref:Uncharacterized protein n=1 Tax=Ridgeia piscesae TaxID=27915 RepID=A0AAD9P5A7_RIDPI|nr:hypothetical protein NP493_132g00024 [Ridgeia piscesae]
MAVCTAGVSLIIAVDRTRTLLEWEHLLDYTDVVCISVMAGMLSAATGFLILSTVSSKPMSSYIFCSTRKNRYARIFNSVIVGAMLVFLAAWVLVCVVITVPVVLLVMLSVLYNIKHVDCINLVHYGLSDEDNPICGMGLTVFYQQSQLILTSYVISLVGSTLVVISLVLYIICTSANVIYLKESPFPIFDIKSSFAREASRNANTRM